MDEALQACRAGLAATPNDDPERAWPLSNLGAALADRFDRFGNVADLDESIEIKRAALAATPDDQVARGGKLSTSRWHC